MLQSPQGIRTMLYIALPIVVLAIVLIRRGLRGRKIDDHPLCSVCGFDLFGKPAESQICSECGTFLGDNNERIRIGHRQRRPRSILVGVCLLLIGGASFEIGIRKFGDEPFEHYLPFRLLLYETHWKNPKHQLAAFRELVKAISAKTMEVS
jgi:predicted nucleic acid-binding Zn ribbon protein